MYKLRTVVAKEFTTRARMQIQFTKTAVSGKARRSGELCRHTRYYNQMCVCTVLVQEKALKWPLEYFLHGEQNAAKSVRNECASAN